MVLLHIKILVITNFCLFLSISYRSEMRTFSNKMEKLAFWGKFKKTIKYSKYGALTYYNPCYTKFPSSSMISYQFHDKNFFEKNGKIGILGEIWKNYKMFKVWCSCTIWTLRSKFSSAFSISYSSEQITFLEKLWVKN